MYFDEFNRLSTEQTKAGRKTATQEEGILIRNEYQSRYARSGKKSSQIVAELSQEFPNFNVPEALRPIMIHTRA